LLKACVNPAYQKLTLKNPITATLVASEKLFASSAEVNVLAAGPDFFFSQLTISSDVRPPAREANKKCKLDTYTHQYHIAFPIGTWSFTVLWDIINFERYATIFQCQSIPFDTSEKAPK